MIAPMFAGIAAAGMLTAAGLVLGAGLAKADTLGDDTAWLTCKTLRTGFNGDVQHDGNYAVGVAEAVADHYHVTLLSAVHIIDYQVQNYCPSLLPQLQAIGFHDGTGGSGHVIDWRTE